MIRQALIGLTAAVLAAPPAPSDPIAPPLTPPGGLSGKCLPGSPSPVSQVPWAQHRLAPQRVWPLTKGAGVLVGVVDTGVDGSVPQLSGRVLDELDVTGQPKSIVDCPGHGTFVAGLIAARSAPGTGFAGIAPEAKILPIRQSVNSSDGTVSGIAKGIRLAVDKGASVVNVSVTSVYGTEELQAAVRYAAERNVLVVAAAANNAQEGNPVSYPGAYPEVLAVGAIGQSGARANFSEAGDFLDLAAPGEGVISTGPRGPGHFQDNGTSYAAPFVTGVAALVRAYRPDLTAAQVKHRLEATADPPPRKAPDRELGWGVVNPHNAVTAVLPEEQGAKPAKAEPVVVAERAPEGPGDPKVWRAFLLAAAAVLVAGAAGIGWVVLPLGRRRRWQAAKSSRELQR